MNVQPRPTTSVGATLIVLASLALLAVGPALAQDSTDAISEREQARQARIEEYLRKKEQRRAEREARKLEKALKKNGHESAPAAEMTEAVVAAEAAQPSKKRKKGRSDSSLPRNLARAQQTVRASAMGNDPSVQRYLDLIDRQEASPQELAAFGNFISQNGLHREAMEYYAVALGLEQDDPVLWINAGTLQRKLGEPGKALGAFDRALNISPNNAFAHYNVGAVLEQMGKYDDAIDAYTMALTLDRSLGDPAHNPAATNNELLLAVRLRLYQQEAGSSGLPLMPVPGAEVVPAREGP